MPTLAYRGRDVIDRIPARLATSVERFEAWLLDIFFTCFGGLALVVVSAFFSFRDSVCFTIGVSWLILSLAGDAFFGVTLGRRSMYLNVRCVDGTVPSRLRLISRVMIRYVWLWPLFALACVILTDAYLDLPWGIFRSIARACWTSSFIGVIVLVVDFIGFSLSGLTFADRLTATRLLVAAPGPVDEAWH